MLQIAYKLRKRILSFRSRGKTVERVVVFDKFDESSFLIFILEIEISIEFPVHMQFEKFPLRLLLVSLFRDNIWVCCHKCLPFGIAFPVMVDIISEELCLGEELLLRKRLRLIRFLFGRFSHFQTLFF